MSAKHRDPLYQKNARIIRDRAKALHRRGEAVACWRCQRPILDGQPFDVGHLPHATGHTLEDLSPEHRHATRYCVGNRSDGGRIGAHITNGTRPTTTQGKVTRWGL